MSRRRNHRQQRRPGTHTKAIPAGIAGNATGKPATTTFADALNRLTATQTWGPARAMPRDSLDAVPFGPINPLTPAPISPARDNTGRPEPRIFEYPVAWNVPGNDTRLIPWDVLYTAAAQVDVMRRCIEVRKRHVRSLDWCFTVSDDAVSAAYRADPRRGRDDLENQLRDQYQPHIDRLTAFWAKPWRSNGMTFGQWVNAIQDQHLTLDAVAIYPRTTYGGDVIDLEILDGATVKPLIDWRGARPAPPHPAFQQHLYGFPRGEYTATTTIDEEGNEFLDGGYKSDQLYYWRETFRPRSLFGFSAVEQALIAARLYMKRQGWMLSEYDDASTPLTWLVPETGAGTELDPRLRREWEQSLNDDLAGQTAARHRIKLSYPGFKPEMMPSVDERYKPDYDLYLIKLLASFFGVPITELGFTESKGLGSSGYHEGQEDVMDRVGRRPDIAVLTEIINDISHCWLDAPKEIAFSFLGLESEDEAAQDAVADTRVRSGRMTYNEDRKRLGLPLYNFPEADMPIVVSTRGGVVFLEGASQAAPPGVLVAPGGTPKTDTPNGENGQQVPGQSDAEQQPAARTGETPAKQGTAKAADPTRAVADSDATRDRVRTQLAEDYPDDAMKWLKTAVWSGPESVPTADIDFSNADSWTAAAEPGKVDRFADKIITGKLKPIILVNTPDARKYIVIDGHHRAMAYRKLGLPAMAYIGRVAAKRGPWEQMHASQIEDSSEAGDASKTAEPATPEQAATELALKAVTDEIAAYHRWAKKNPNPKRPFRFTHPGAEQMAKAGDADPKAPPVRSWPGWERDEATAAHYARALRDMLTARVDPDRLAQRWAEARGMAKDLDDGEDGDPTQPDPSADARGWLSWAGITAAVAAALNFVLRDAWTDGYYIGDRSARAVVFSVGVDWGGWTPGDPAAAARILGTDGSGAGLTQLLDNSGITIKSIAAGRIDQLAQALADALAAGDSPDTLARRLRGILDDPQWADLVAVTEINRAVSAATLAVYGANGIDGKSWMTAGDDRVCPLICEPNGIDGPIPVAALFTSGVDAPPGHPRCRCALSPEFLTPDQAEGGP